MILSSCTENLNYYEKSLQVINQQEYNSIYQSVNDSFKLWINCKTKIVEPETYYPYSIDSLMCFDSSRNRFIGCTHLYVKTKEAKMDGLDFLYGEKINNHWYYFRGASVSIPRETIEGHPKNKPLSYQQLHQIALKEIYSGYLNINGEINDAWFTSHFEGSGWGDFNDQSSSLKYLGSTEKFTDKRKFFEAIHLQGVRNNWFGVKKDSIKTLP